MVAPLLQAQVDIEAPVSTVWALVSDFRRMPQWSPQCRLMRALGPVRPGTRTVNVNRRNLLFWPTTATVIEVIPDQKLAFRVNTNNTVWSYELQPIPEGTRVIESRPRSKPRPRTASSAPRVARSAPRVSRWPL
jgi:uncharacterized protein YndB with AHSA1/START domain